MQHEENLFLPCNCLEAALQRAQDSLWGSVRAFSRCPAILPLLCPQRAGRASTARRRVREGGKVSQLPRAGAASERWIITSQVINLPSAPAPPPAARSLQPLLITAACLLLYQTHHPSSSLGNPGAKLGRTVFTFLVPRRLRFATVMISSKSC